MSDVTLKNENLKIEVNLHGAELKSLYKMDTDTEYLWCADPAYWNRTSPVLFPFVGGVKNGVYRHNGVEGQKSGTDRDVFFYRSTSCF